MLVPLALYFLTVHFCASSSDYIPRLTFRKDSTGRLQYSGNKKHSVLYHKEGDDDIYVGGRDTVFRISIEQRRITQNFSLVSIDGQSCEETSCGYNVTVIQQFQDTLYICGTNGQNPQCWKLYLSKGNQSSNISASFEGRGISPYLSSQNSLTLTAGTDMYAAAPLYRDGSLLYFRRKVGPGLKIWMYDEWVMEPTFISATWVKRKDDPENDKIYIFFREKNSDNNPEADPWISRVAQVCKVDQGGPKRILQNTWTSFLKARLICGIPEEALYFNRLQDIFVQEADDWRDSRVYALFTSSWNSSAICIYSVSDIDRIFQHSAFKDFHENIPHPRPGTCVPDSRSLPVETMSVVKYHPEMNDWIHPINRRAPFYISGYKYTKIAVDRVMGLDQHLYNVLFLATESSIHKVLDYDSTPFIISETIFPGNGEQILSMKLDSKKRKLLVGLPDELALMDLESCQDYSQSCAACVLARDPYCAWSEAGCVSAMPGAIQDAAGGITKICEGFGRLRMKRQTQELLPGDALKATYSVRLGLPIYLSCPIRSHHATYSWLHKGESRECQQVESSCLHLISTMGEDNYGIYECISKERDYTQVVKVYELDHKIENAGALLLARGSAAMALTAVLLVKLCL